MQVMSASPKQVTVVVTLAGIGVFVTGMFFGALIGRHGLSSGEPEGIYRALL